MTGPNKFLTAEEVAERLGLSVLALQKRRQRRRPPRFYQMGRSIRYALADIEEYEKNARREVSD